MSKILNLDAFATPSRALVLGGKEYKVKDINLQSFIDSLKLAEEMEAKGAMTPKESVEVSIRYIKDAVPDLPEELVRKMNFEQLGAVMQFIRGEMDEKLVGTEQKDAGVAAPAVDKS